MVTFEAFVGFLVQITEDTTSPDQVRESFRGIAGDKVRVIVSLYVLGPGG
jgi:hypothetical protein